MRVADPYKVGLAPERWPTTVAEAEADQDRLRAARIAGGPLPAPLTTVAGLDVSYETGGDRLVAAVVVLRADDLTLVESATEVGAAAFDYVPGLFAYRELPALLAALAALDTVPDVLVCDGHGLAHPLRFGLACQLGVLTGLPTFGVGKTRLVGTYAEPGPNRGDCSDLIASGEGSGLTASGEGSDLLASGDGSDLLASGEGSDPNASGSAGADTPEAGGEVVGRVLRTRDGVKPVFVSVGHRIDLAAACALTLRLTPAFRLPETTRAADHLSREVLAGR